jgi:hypothetical protein
VLGSGRFVSRRLHQRPRHRVEELSQLEVVDIPLGGGEVGVALINCVCVDEERPLLIVKALNATSRANVSSDILRTLIVLNADFRCCQ